MNSIEMYRLSTPGHAPMLFDASNDEVSEASARIIFTMLKDSGNFVKHNPVVADEDKVRYLATAANKLWDEFPDVTERVVARQVKRDRYIGDVGATLAGEKRYRLFHSFENADEMKSDEHRKMEFAERYYPTSHKVVDTGIYVEVALSEMIPESGFVTMVEVEIKADEYTGSDEKWFDGAVDLRLTALNEF